MDSYNTSEGHIKIEWFVRKLEDMKIEYTHIKLEVSELYNKFWYFVTTGQAE